VAEVEVGEGRAKLGDEGPDTVDRKRGMIFGVFRRGLRDEVMLNNDIS
jgi:hypothetical protein